MKKLVIVAASCTFLCHAARDITHAFAEKNSIPVAVIGAGPAGYTAGMYTARAAGLPTYIFTGPNRGGQLMGTSWVENYPGIKKIEGSSIPEIMAEQAQEAGAVIIEDTITEVNLETWPFKLVTDRGTELYALTVIITTGSTPKKLGIPGEEKYWGSGVSSCALCDGMFFKDKDVVVVGGGDAAIEEALQLSSYAKSITILVRSNRMRAVNKMQEKLKDYSTIKIVYNKQVTEVLGDREGVTGLEIIDTETGEKGHLKAEGLFLAIGHTPNTELFQDQLELKPSGHIALEGRSQETSIAGVFAAGDVEDAHFRQAIVAAGHGCQAGLEAVSWLHEVGLTKSVLEKNQEKLFVSKG